MLPTFIIVGAMKCGTSSLYHYLNLHPEVFMARSEQRTKTIHYFSKNEVYARGAEWYESLFDGEAKAYGEASGTYTKYPNFDGVPGRMHAMLPEVQLIYLVRDPIERIVSHHNHRSICRLEDRSIDEVLMGRKGRIYLDSSKYHMQIERYLPYYDKSRILIICSEDLKRERALNLKRVFEFIGVDSSFYTPRYDKLSHVTVDKFRKVGQRRSTSRWKRLIRFRSRNDEIRASPTTELKPSTRAWLVEQLQEDVDAFRQFTGQSFSQWQL